MKLRRVAPWWAQDKPVQEVEVGDALGRRSGVTSSIRARGRVLKHWYTNREAFQGKGPWTGEEHAAWEDAEHLCSCGEVFPDGPTWWAHHSEESAELTDIWASIFGECMALVDQMVFCCHNIAVCCWPPMDDDDGHGCHDCEIGNHDRRGIAYNKHYNKQEETWARGYDDDHGQAQD